MMFLSLISCLLSVSSQPAGVPLYNQVSFMNSLPLPARGNHSIGYLPSSISSLNSSFACRRLKMFKFQAKATGLATTLTMNTLPVSTPEFCSVSFNLYSFPDGAMIGGNFMGVFNRGSSSTGSTIGGNPGFIMEYSTTVNVSSAGWVMSNGTFYYLVIQTFTYSTIGTSCIIVLPYGIDTAKPPIYALLVEQGPSEMPCGSSPWIPVAALDGGYIHMSINGYGSTPSYSPYLRASITSTPTPGVLITSSSNTPTSSSTPTITSSSTPTITSSSTPTITSSSTPTTTISSTGTDTTTGSDTTSASASVSATGSPTQIGTSSSSFFIAFSSSNTPTPAASPVRVSITKNATAPIDTSLAAAAVSSGSVSSEATGNIIGGVIGAIVCTVLISGIIAFHMSRSVRTQVGKYTGIKEARSPISSDRVITMNPVNNLGSFDTAYHNNGF